MFLELLSFARKISEKLEERVADEDQGLWENFSMLSKFVTIIQEGDC